MVLNNKPQMFLFSFPSTFFYKEVTEKWTPYVERLKLPYMSVHDFMNNHVQSVKFPGLTMDTSMQQREQYEVAYPGGKELEPLIGKDLTITFKSTESYLSYFIFWDQIDIYLHYHMNKNVWMEPITMAFLSDAGLKMMEFEFREMTPTSISEINLSYAATVAQYNTFTVSFKYNNFIVK